MKEAANWRSSRYEDEMVSRHRLDNAGGFGRHLGHRCRDQVIRDGLVPFSLRDQHRDHDDREGDNHPVLEWDAQKREPLSQPVVQGGPQKLLKNYSRERA